MAPVPRLSLSTTLRSALAGPALAALWALRWRRPDPWRRTLGLGLRGEGAKFALSAFGLKADAGESDLALAQRLAAWIAADPAPRYTLHFGDPLVERRPTRHAHCALLEFDPGSGELTRLEPLWPAVPDPADSPAADLWRSAPDPTVDLLRAFHGATRHRPESERTRQLSDFAGSFSTRLAASIAISFEETSADARFTPPDFTRRRGLGGSGLDLVLRRQRLAGNLDVWIQVQHTVDDGAPRQEWLDRLASHFGASEPEFPADAGHSPAAPRLCSVPGERPIHLAHDFIDLSPIRAWARARQAPVAAALIWWLGWEDAFAGRRFGVAVDVPAGDGFPRAVDLIGMRPAEHADFESFSAHFQARAAAARTRRGQSWQALRNATFLPAGLALDWMRAKESLAAEAFGTVGLTMLRQARVFVAPMADFGWRDGFLALGSTALPAAGGGKVTSVTMKGESVETCAKLAALRSAARRCAASEKGG